MRAAAPVLVERRTRAFRRLKTAAKAASRRPERTYSRIMNNLVFENCGIWFGLRGIVCAPSRRRWSSSFAPRCSRNLG